LKRARLFQYLREELLGDVAIQQLRFSISTLPQ
jgi:hypothetical protein